MASLPSDADRRRRPLLDLGPGPSAVPGVHRAHAPQPGQRLADLGIRGATQLLRQLGERQVGQAARSPPTSASRSAPAPRRRRAVGGPRPSPPARTAARSATPTSPPFSSPSMLASGTRALVRNTSLKPGVAGGLAQRPYLDAAPGASGKKKNEMPRCLGTSQSVRAISMPYSAWRPPEVHTFWPLTIHSSPSRSARVLDAAPGPTRRRARCRAGTWRPCPTAAAAGNVTSGRRCRRPTRCWPTG